MRAFVPPSTISRLVSSSPNKSPKVVVDVAVTVVEAVAPPTAPVTPRSEVPGVSVVLVSLIYVTAAVLVLVCGVVTILVICNPGPVPIPNVSASSPVI